MRCPTRAHLVAGQRVQRQAANTAGTSALVRLSRISSYLPLNLVAHCLSLSSPKTRSALVGLELEGPNVSPRLGPETVIYLRSIYGRPKVAPRHRFGISHVAARSKRARRNVALHFWSQTLVLSTDWIPVMGALSIEASACLSFGTTGTRSWPRRRRLPPSSLLSC